jgi:hypothetical protein
MVAIRLPQRRKAWSVPVPMAVSTLPSMSKVVSRLPFVL